MSTVSCRQALRSTSTDPRPLRPWIGGLLFAAAAVLAATSFATAEADAAAELALARRPELYVVVDPARETVEIKIRGQAFVTLALDGWGLFAYRGPSESAPPEANLPASFVVTGDPDSTARRVETVDELRPFGEETVENAGTAADATPRDPQRPASYELPLESGWTLRVAPRLPPVRGFAAWTARVADGWAVRRGRPPARPPLLALALEADAARRLHHVLRPGTAILVRSQTADRAGMPPP
jgi:hypothetical protein